MKRPKEIKNRIEREINITLASFNRINLLEIQHRIMTMLNDFKILQENQPKEEIVWIGTVGGEK